MGSTIKKAGAPRASAKRQRGKLASFVRDNGLSIAFLALFVLAWAGQALTGWYDYNDEQAEHGEEQVGFGQFLKTGTFLESTAENWESEFLQMAAFVSLAALLYQRGSSESKDPDKYERQDEDPLRAKQRGSPAPVHRGGLALRLYSHSLALTLFALFALSFALHALGGKMQLNEEARQHGQPAVTLLQYVGTPRFWFESLQNWQSEFLSVGALVLLSVFLREKGSAGSKAVATPHHETE